MKTVRLETTIERSSRVMQLEGMFDLESTEKSVTEIPFNIPELSSRDWNIGLIVGPSGAGKSTIARKMFENELQQIENFEWSKNKAVIDDFSNTLSIREITELLSSVGFSSPPSWLRPFHTLSNGEQFRVTMARVIAETNQDKIAVVDEFTSVIDRTVAKIGSHAIAKTIRRRNQKFVAVGCHYDVEDWLQPDWIYEPHTGSFRWEGLRQRPPVELQIFRAKYEAWGAFSKHHYLDAKLNKSANVYVATVEGQPAALIALLTLMHPQLKNTKRISRIVVLPDFQGIGLGIKFMDALCGSLLTQGFETYITTSHPAMMRALNHSKNWAVYRKPSRVSAVGKTSTQRLRTSGGRITAGFRFNGQLDDVLVNVLAPKPVKV